MHGVIGEISWLKKCMNNGGPLGIELEMMFTRYLFMLLYS